jgi:hypothetical protein
MDVYRWMDRWMDGWMDGKHNIDKACYNGHNYMYITTVTTHYKQLHV